MIDEVFSSRDGTYLKVGLLIALLCITLFTLGQAVSSSFPVVKEIYLINTLFMLRLTGVSTLFALLIPSRWVAKMLNTVYGDIV